MIMPATSTGGDNVSRYFDRNAARWGRHYDDTGLFLRLFNWIFRRALKRRWDITMRHALPAEGRTYLDIGCGTGVYSLTLARAGAVGVTAIDSAREMIDLSRRRAADEGLSKNCDFVHAEFMGLNITKKSDVVFAIGVFDYIKDYRRFWQKMASASNGVVIGSFPKHSLLREPIRRYRYRRKQLPVYFYSRDQIESLGRQPGFARYEIEELDAGYVLIGFVR